MMKWLRNICIVLGLICTFGVYLGFNLGKFEVVTILAVGAVMCAFMAIYCQGEIDEDNV